DERMLTARALDRRSGAGPRTHLCRPRRRPQPPFAAILRVDFVVGAEGAEFVDRTLARAREPNRLLRSADLLQRRKLVPPRENEAAVPAARAAAADVRLEQHHLERGLELLEADRSPETAVAA